MKILKQREKSGIFERHGILKKYLLKRLMSWSCNFWVIQGKTCHLIWSW